MKVNPLLQIAFLASILSNMSFCILEDKVALRRFGSLTVYRQTDKEPASVALFVSGDGGWNLGVISMAKAIVSQNALVVGIDIRKYLTAVASSPEKCSYAAADFESLSHFIQKKYGFHSYMEPILLGYSSGATLVYAVLAQAPTNTFLGAVSLGFCPDLVLRKPLCRQRGLEWRTSPKAKGYYFLPATRLESPWIVLNGQIDQVCRQADTTAYTQKVSSAQLIALPKVGHGFSVEKNWMPQLITAMDQLTPKKVVAPSHFAISEGIKDLPLVEISAKSAKRGIVAVLYSGDGGWTTIDKDIASALSESGVDVVGINSLKYLWNGRTVEGGTRDLEQMLSHYLSFWKDNRALLIGYSLGADFIPLVAHHISKDLLSKITVVALVSPSTRAELEFHVTDWLNIEQKNSIPSKPEVDKIDSRKVICFYGQEEQDSLCPQLDARKVEIKRMAGGHHLGGDYPSIARDILEKSVRSP